MNSRYKQWLEHPSIDPETKETLKSMNEAEIEEAFAEDLAFGTGGMRGIVGPGNSRLNTYTVRKAVYGYAQFLLERHSDATRRGVAIAHDNRRGSKAFTEAAIGVLTALGFVVHAFEELRITPMLSYAVRKLNAAGGIMVTASHNPPEYNGVKMYDEHGCQLVPSLADQVIDQVESVEDYLSIDTKPLEDAREEGLLNELGREMDDAYLDAVSDVQFAKDAKKQLKVVFTPLHGAAGEIGRRALEENGFEVHTVDGQMEPDPDFSTVDSPNPENPSAFALAKQLGEKIGADLLIATDPDGDRLAVMARHEGRYEFLSGNQTGALFIDYILSRRKERGILPEAGGVYNTVVTSEFGATIARSYGMEVISTLTGFKFIGEQMRQIEDADQTFIMGYEESYGYVLRDIVRDKDSIQAALLAAELADALKREGRTMVDYLDKLYQTYGAFRDKLINVVLKGREGKEAIENILADFRKQPPRTLIGRDLLVQEDYREGVRIENEEERPLDYPVSNVLKYIYTDDCWFVLRPSGTEPKLKIYLNVKADSIDAADRALENMESEIIKRVEPHKPKQ